MYSKWVTDGLWAGRVYVKNKKNKNGTTLLSALRFTFKVNPRPFGRKVVLFIRYEGLFEGATALNGVAVKFLDFKQCVVSV